MRVGHALPYISAFTIIELLVVISIIIVLAGLVLATSGYVATKGRRSRAEAEIAAMSAALESYKADNGIYPTDDTATQQRINATAADPNKYTTGDLYLYKQLSGDSADRHALTLKNLFRFQAHAVESAKTAQNCSCYSRSFGKVTVTQQRQSQIPPILDAGYNPTFDLWIKHW